MEPLRSESFSQKRRSAAPFSLSEEMEDRLSRLADLRGMRSWPATGPTATDTRTADATAGPTATDTRPAATAVGAKDAPWTADHLLANPTDMNDEYVSIEVSPTTGDLYALFEATDLGGTDRDIHIARSQNAGATWQVWEMPSDPLDEYHADLAIDGAGYLHAAWIVDDGTIVAIRSSNPDDPLNWEEPYGLYVGDPCVTPSIAVSGAGQFSTTFVVAGWWAFNSDTWQSEYTLVWFYSLNGGATFSYDYFLPDGYQDLWPDVALNGGTAYLVNAEMDYYTGELEILLDADAVSGGFVTPVLLSDWTAMDCGFPSLAADGPNVYCAYQLDYDDGMGTVDGDVIYCFSWDGAQNVYGPYELVADEYESVGPAIFTRDGLVGCVWLDAPAGGDEFDLVGRQAGMDGHPDFWGGIETVTDQHYVDPTFRSADGAVASSTLHAAWVDRRDFPTQGLNVYTCEKAKWPNLTWFAPEGWDSPLVASMIPGERQNGPLGAIRTTYVSFAFTNTGLHDATRDFFVELTVDGLQVGLWVVPGGLPLGTYVAIEDYEISVTAGMHELAFAVDTGDDVNESDESDNSYGDMMQWIDGDPELRVTPDPVIHVVPAAIKSASGAAGTGMVGGTADITTELSGFVRALAESPPVMRKVHLPVIDERLAKTLITVGPAERLRVAIVPAQRVDLQALADRLKSASQRERRPAMALALRGQMAQAKSALADVTSELIRRDEMDEPAELWLSGLLVARMTPAAVRQLAAHPKVGWLWLDDRRSETFVGAASVSAQAEPEPAVTLALDKALAWHLTRIGADQAWAQGYDGAGVIVGHIDSGVAYDHPDLAGQLWDGSPTYPHHGYDYLDEDDDPYDGDTSFWHGTHTAGLIAGDGTSGTATGTAPGARLMILRAVPGYLEDSAQALQFCLDNGAQVISMSAGWTDPDPGLREANRFNAEVLLAAGIPWVCAVGNGDNMGGHFAVPRDISSPADSPHPWYGAGGHSAAIGVGATDIADQVYIDSSIGPTEWNITGENGYDDYPYPPGLIKPDLAAPGVNVTSTTLPSGYVNYTGSSMAAPLVAGACAILLQANGMLQPVDLAELLESTAIDIDVAGRDNRAGAGLLDIPTALANLPSSDAEYFWVHNDGPLPLNLTGVGWHAAWLTIAPTDAVVAAGDSVRFVATFDPTGYGDGVYTDDVILTSNDPDSPDHLTVKMIVGDVVTVGDGDQSPPVVRSGLTAYPNPFNPQTVVAFEVRRPGHVRLDIYDIRGRLVKRLHDGAMPAGRQEIAWNGLDDAGRPVGSGTYVLMYAGPEGARLAQKLALVR